MYEVGELSIIIVSLRSRPTWDRSCNVSAIAQCLTCNSLNTYLDVVTLVVVATLAEQAVMDDLVYIKLIKQRISVLFPSQRVLGVHSK